ncbi:MAG: efflux RND transporter periplasmic adaptor subunit [Burkholderiales bacterium]
MTRNPLMLFAIATGLTLAAGFARAQAVPAPAAAGTGSAEVAAIVHAGEETTLSSQMAGKVRRIAVGLGDQFKSGARLIEFDCSEQQAQLESAQAEYRGARETHLARLRLQALGAAGELEVTLAASAADKARSQVALRESQLAYCGVNAPFPGKVVRLRVKTAESVPAGQALIDLVNPASLKLQMFVPAAWASWLRPNVPLKVRFNDGPDARTVNARVSKINARIEGVSQQLEVEARFESGTGGLLPGMVGTALFEQPRS